MAAWGDMRTFVERVFSFADLGRSVNCFMQGDRVMTT